MIPQILNHTLPPLPTTTPTMYPLRMVARQNTSESLIPHSHARGQVTHAIEGVIRVTVGNSTWIVPPFRAIWIPPGKLHGIQVLEKVRLRNSTSIPIPPIQGRRL